MGAKCFKSKALEDWDYYGAITALALIMNNLDDDDKVKVIRNIIEGYPREYNSALHSALYKAKRSGET